MVMFLISVSLVDLKKSNLANVENWQVNNKPSVNGLTLLASFALDFSFFSSLILPRNFGFTF